jgi:hypothetical protein
MDNLYIYLARLDRKGMKILASFPHGSTIYPTRVRDLSRLGLNRDLFQQVSSEMQQNKMTHELYFESAPSFELLLVSLRERGYVHLPMNQFGTNVVDPRINDADLLTKKSTMIQRVSPRR